MNIEEKLQAPFEEKDIEWRIGRSGESKGKVWALCLAYVTNRAIQNRLDEVFGVLNWQNEFREWHQDSQLCGISVYDPDKKEWITKWDGADTTNFEATKGGLSDAMKRCAVQFGIGRYLYKLDEGFAEVSMDKVRGWKKAQTKSGKTFWWNPPKLPEWAVKAPEMTSKQQKPKIDIKIPEQRNYTEEASNCKDMKELKAWWDKLSTADKTFAKLVKKNRKEELLAEAEDADTYKPKDLVTEMLKTANNSIGLGEVEGVIDTVKDSKKRLGYINQLKKKIAELGINYEMNILPF